MPHCWWRGFFTLIVVDVKKQITLRHLMLDGQKYIGMQYHADKVVEALVNQLPDVKWHGVYKMAYIPNKGNAVTLLFNTFKGVACLPAGRQG